MASLTVAATILCLALAWFAWKGVQLVWGVVTFVGGDLRERRAEREAEQADVP